MQKASDIEIWHWPLHFADEAAREQHAAILSTDETHRARKLLSTRHRDEFIAARAGLRRILAGALNTTTETLVFSYGPHGKPVLETQTNEPSLHFNIAHSGGQAALALSPNNEVGIDIEQHRDIDIRIAKRFFTAREWQIISTAKGTRQQELFFRCWVLKEAVLKTTGEGIQRGLDSFDVSLDDLPARILQIDGCEKTAAQWHLHTFSLAPDIPGALAIENSGNAIEVSTKPWSLTET
ncbi:MAG: 4'-phosphopantetheinyl transferase family protein [Hyphomicrobiaceae bacterium]